MGLKISFHRSIDVLCKVFNVMVVQTSHGYTAIGSHVNMSFLRQDLCLRGIQPSEAVYILNKQARRLETAVLT